MSFDTAGIAKELSANVRRRTGGAAAFDNVAAELSSIAKRRTGKNAATDRTYQKAETEARKKARQKFIYADKDTSNFTYKTVAEYDAEISRLEEMISSNQGMVYDYRGSVAQEKFEKRNELERQLALLKSERFALAPKEHVEKTYGHLKTRPDFAANSGVVQRDQDLSYVAVNYDDYYDLYPEHYDNDGWVDGGFITSDNMRELAEKYGWSDEELGRRESLSADLRLWKKHFEEQIRSERVIDGLEMMTDEERAIYNYLYNTGDRDGAKQYLADMKLTLQMRQSASYEWDAVDEYENASEAEKVWMNVETFYTKLMGTLEAGINDAIEALFGEYSPYGYKHKDQVFTDAVRSKTASDIYDHFEESTGSDTLAKLASTAYQSGMSVGDMILGTAVLGQTGFLIASGVDVASHKAKELYESGAEGWQIALGSLASGVIEGAIEKMPLEKLAKMAKNTGSFKALVKGALQQMGIEGAEEAITEISNIISDSIIQGGNSDLSRQIAAYEKQGYTAEQAQQMAFRDKVEDVLWAGIGGMAAGGPSSIAFGGTGLVREYSATRALGNEVMATEGGLQTAIGEGLSTPRATQAHKQAAALAQRVEAGKSASPYRVGQMVLQTAAPETRQAVALAQLTRQSAAPYAVNEQTVETVADIAAGTGRQIVFGNLPTAEGDNAVGGQYDPQTGVITINPDAATDEVVEFLTKHELTHSVQDTHQWEQLADIVEAQMGDDAWSAAIAEEMERRSIDLTQAEREVVADWVGKNLYKAGFVQAVVNADAAMGNTMLRAVDRLRLALGNKKSRSKTNLAVVERLFMRALEQEQVTHEGDVEYSIEYLREKPNGDIIDLLRKVESGEYKQNDKVTLGTVDSATSEKIRQITGIDVSGWKVAIEARQLKHILNRHGKNGAADNSMADEADIAKMEYALHNAEHIVDGGTSHAYTNFVNGKDRPAKTVLYQKDIGGVYYYVVQAVPDTKRRTLFVDSAFINKTKKVEDLYSANALSPDETPESASTATSTNTKIPQNAPGVNPYSMQDGENNSQNSIVNRPWLQGDTSVDMYGNPNIYREDVDPEEYTAGFLDQEQEAVRKRKNAHTEKARRAADLETMRRVQRGEITPEEGAEETAGRRQEQKQDIDRQYRTGNRGPRQVREMTKENNRRQSEVKREERERTETRQKVVKLKDELTGMLTNPTKKRHIPAPLVEGVAELLEAIVEDPAAIESDIASLRRQIADSADPVRIEKLEKRLERRKRQLQNVSDSLGRIRRVYEKYSSDTEYGGLYDERFASRIRRVQDLLDGKSVSQLDAREMRELYDILRATATQAREYNQARSAAINKGVRETAEALAAQINTVKTPKLERVKMLSLWQLTPSRFFNEICGWVKGNAGQEIADALAEGESRHLKIKRDFGNRFNGLANEKEYTKLTDTRERNLVDVGLVDEKGQTVRLTRGLMLSLYRHLSCYGNRTAIMDGGLHVPNLKRYYAGDIANAYAKGGQRLTVTGLTAQIHDALIRVAEATTQEERQEGERELAALTERANQDIDRVLKTIEGLMTPYEKKLMAAAADWFDNASKGYINDATMLVWGYESARVEHYFPIHRNTDFVNKPIEALISDQSLEGSGFLKERVRSKAPVLLTDISAELESSCDSVSRLAGYLPFTSDFQKIYNGYAADGKNSVKSIMAEKYGKGGTKLGVTGQRYVENLLADIAGARTQEASFLSVFRRNAVRATMSVNLRVAASQLSALPTASAELGWEYVSKAVRHMGKISEQEREIMLRNSEYLYERSLGAGGTEEIHLAREGHNPVDKLYNALDKATKGRVLSWCQAVDVKTVSTLWYGCMEKIKDTQPDLKEGSEAFYEAVGQELNRVIRKTQANYTVTDMSDLMRSKSEALKFLTMFKADANQSFNILYEATARYRQYRADFAANRNGVTEADVKQAKQALINGYTGVIGGTVVAFALMRALINFLTHNVNGYRDDDGEITGASVAAGVGQEMLSSIAGMFVFGDVVYEALAARVFGDNYYGISDMALETVGDVLNDIATGNYTTSKGWTYLMKDLFKAAGIPYQNIAKLCNGVRYHIEDICNGEFLSMNAGYTVGVSAYYARLYNAMKKGDSKKAEILRQYLLAAGKTEAQIDSGLREAAKKNEAGLQQEVDRLLLEIMEDELYDRLEQAEKTKVRNGVLGYVADQKLQKIGGNSLTKAHQKAETVIEKGIGVGDYYLMQIAKNAVLADENSDGEVSKAEYRHVVLDTDYDEYVKRILIQMKGD